MHGLSVLSGKNLRLKCAWWMKAGGEKADHPSLSAPFYHGNSGLLIEVEEDNDHIYSSTHLYFRSLHIQPPLSAPFIPSTQPGRVYLMTQAISFFPLLPSQPAEPERVCVCVCLRVCV